MVSCCRLLGVRFFVLEVRSWSGNDVLVILYQMNVILCSDKKGQGPKAQLFPSEVQVLTEGPPLVAPSGTVPQTPPSWYSLREPGVQDPTGL